MISAAGEFLFSTYQNDKLELKVFSNKNPTQHYDKFQHAPQAIFFVRSVHVLALDVKCNTKSSCCFQLTHLGPVTSWSPSACFPALEAGARKF